MWSRPKLCPLFLIDPGRLISSHIMHTALLAGWSALMLLYELITIDPTSNLIWTYETMNISPYSIIWFINSCIFLALAYSVLGFGLAHLTGFLGPGMWTSDS